MSLCRPCIAGQQHSAESGPLLGAYRRAQHVQRSLLDKFDGAPDDAVMLQPQRRAAYDHGVLHGTCA